MKFSWIFIILIVLVIVFTSISRVWNFPYTSREPACISIADSKWRKLHLKTINCDTVKSDILPDEAWIEESYALSSFGFRGNKTGVRMCLKFEDQNQPSSDLFCDYVSGKKVIEGRYRTLSKNYTIFILDTDSIGNFNFPGTATFYLKSNEPPVSKVYLTESL